MPINCDGFHNKKVLALFQLEWLIHYPLKSIFLLPLGDNCQFKLDKTSCNNNGILLVSGINAEYSLNVQKYTNSSFNESGLLGFCFCYQGFYGQFCNERHDANEFSIFYFIKKQLFIGADPEDECEPSRTGAKCAFVKNAAQCNFRGFYSEVSLKK